MKKKRMVINRLKEFGHMPRMRNRVYTIYLPFVTLLRNEKCKEAVLLKYL